MGQDGTRRNHSENSPENRGLLLLCKHTNNQHSCVSPARIVAGMFVLFQIVCSVLQFLQGHRWDIRISEDPWRQAQFSLVS